MLDVIQDLVVPPPVVEFHSYRHPAGLPAARAKANSESGYLVVSVQALPEPERFALVRKMQGEGDALVPGVVLPVRYMDPVRYHSADEVYRLVNDGYGANFREPRPPTPASSGPDASQLSTNLLRSQGWDSGQPVLLWHSWPAGQPDLLDEWTTKLPEYMRGQRPLRPHGFNFFNPYVPLTREGEWLAVTDPRMALRVSTHGVVSAGALADDEFLAWASQERGQPGRLNVVALSEATVEYFRFVSEQVMPLAPGRWTHYLAAHYFESAVPPVELAPGANVEFPFQGRPELASTDDWTHMWTANGDFARDSYESLKSVYALFGLSVQGNPYVTAEGSLDVEALRREG